MFKRVYVLDSGRGRAIIFASSTSEKINDERVPRPGQPGDRPDADDDLTFFTYCNAPCAFACAMTVFTTSLISPGTSALACRNIPSAASGLPISL